MSPMVPIGNTEDSGEQHETQEQRDYRCARIGAAMHATLLTSTTWPKAARDLAFLLGGALLIEHSSPGGKLFGMDPDIMVFRWLDAVRKAHPEVEDLVAELRALDLVARS